MPTPPTRATRRIAGKGDQRRAPGGRRDAARSGARRAGADAPLRAEPKPIEHAVKYYEKGDRPLEFISTPPVVRAPARQEGRAPREGRRDPLAPGLHAAALPQLDREPERRLVRQPPALLRRAVPGLVSARRRRRARLRAPDRRARATTLPVDPDRRRAAGLHAPSSATSPAASPPRPTSSTPGSRARSRRRSARGWLLDPDAPRASSSRPTCARRATRSSGRGPSTRSRRRCCTRTRFPGSTSSISGWILDPDRKKMSKSKGNVVTPMHLLDAVRRRRRALLGGERAARHRHRVRREGVEGRQAAGHQALQRRQVRARAGGRRARRSTPSSTARSSHRLRALVDARDGGASTSSSTRRRSQETESFFWRDFTDTYLELVKARARDAGAAARRSRRSRLGLVVLLRLFAPVLPYITEEVWSWVFADETRPAEHPPRAVAGRGRLRRVAAPARRRLLRRRGRVPRARSTRRSPRAACRSAAASRA